jgi:hypothetical protein
VEDVKRMRNAAQEAGNSHRSLRCCSQQHSSLAQTVPRISANRNRAVFQLSFVPEFSGFFASARRQGISFDAVALELGASIAENKPL